MNFESKGNIVVLDGLPQFYETAGLFLLYTAKLKDVTIKVDLIKFGESKDHLFSFNFKDRIKYNEVFHL